MCECTHWLVQFHLLSDAITIYSGSGTVLCVHRIRMITELVWLRASWTHLHATVLDFFPLSFHTEHYMIHVIECDCELCVVCAASSYDDIETLAILLPHHTHSQWPLNHSTFLRTSVYLCINKKKYLNMHVKLFRRIVYTLHLWKYTTEMICSCWRQ